MQCLRSLLCNCFLVFPWQKPISLSYQIVCYMTTPNEEHEECWMYIGDVIIQCPIQSIIIWVMTKLDDCSGSLICLLQVWLQTELEDIKYYYQFIIKVTISEKRRIAKICNLDCWHKHLCHRINKITGPLKYCHCSRGKKSPFWRKPKFRSLCTVSMVIETKLVIGWFKLQLWVWLAYWTVW